MLLIFKKGLFLVGLTLYIICAHSQTVTSTRNGVWTDPATWVGGIVPTSVTATQIIIDHEVELPLATAVSALRVVVNNKLTLKSTATLNIVDDGLPAIPDLQVVGTFVMEDGSSCNGTSSLNTRFEAGSTYLHQQGPLGFIPYATWDRNSTFIINGFKTSGYINIAHSDSWKQTFGNVVYNCPEQSSFVDLNGYLRNVQGDFTIIHTRNQALRLSTTQNPVISIGGNLRIEGPSQVWMSTNGSAASVSIAGDFSYTSTAICYLTTRGRITVSIGGSFNVNTPSVIRMTSLSADSVGIREAAVNIGQGLSIAAGVLAAPPPGNGKGTITFNGVSEQLVVCGSNGESFLGSLDFVVENNAIVTLGNSALSNTSGSLVVRGTLRVGSAHPLGAIQLTNNGNIRISGTRTFEPGSTVEYNGTSPQYIGDGHPVSPGVHLICNNSSTLSMLTDLVSVNDFSAQTGSFLSGIYTLGIQGNFVLDPTATIVAPSIRFSGNQDQTVSAAGKRLTNVNINKTGGTTVALTSPLILDGLLQIESVNTGFQSNGFLTLASTSDNAGGTATVGPLPAGSTISGDVTVERFMAGEGRIYRYISSPVSNASVADLMDDFPVTGTFADPSTGPGINSPAPSFFFYDESVGALQAGWRPYPTAGLASVNPLQPGRGYAAFIRNGSTPTTWNVTGPLNQGDIQLQVAFTPNGQPSNGWNLIGNPYACTIDWDITGSTGWTKENISQVISIRDNGTSGAGTFRYWDGDINYSDIPNGQIASGQSIWVRATAANPSLIIREGVKVPNSAAFYRENVFHVPSFAVVIKRDSLSDKAFFKIRAGATSGLDDWDAIKQENDNFDIATFSNDGLSLAINARDKLPCQTEHIQLNVKDLTAGEYDIELIKKYDFEQFRYTWIDRYLNTETIVGAEKEIRFSVTSDDESRATDRFVIRLEEPLISDTISVDVPPVICPAQPGVATIHTSRPGIYYSLRDEKGKQVSSEKLGTGGDLQVELLLDSISQGQSLFSVVARSSCNRKELKTSYAVRMAQLPEISATSSRECMGNPVELTVLSGQGIRYSWFEDENSGDTLSTSEKFMTPSLIKPKTYYVTATSAEGCSTSRFPVRANIITYDSARISWVDGSTVSSNYSDSNSWYLNGNILESEHDQTLMLERSGIYTLEVDTLGCITRDSIEFLTTASLKDVEQFIAVFPNPAKGEFYIQGLHQNPFDVEIRNVMGEVVWRAREVHARSVDVTALAVGVYLAYVSQEGVERVVRFVKCE